MRLVSVNDLRPGMVLGKTILGNQGQILLRQGVLLTEGYISYLEKHPFAAVYISTGRDVVVEDVVSDETRIQAIQQTRALLLEVKRGAELEIAKVNEILVAVIDELLLRDDIMINLVDLRSFDEELFSHSVNVAIIAVIVGIDYGCNMKELETLAQAALLHDIGYLLSQEPKSTAHVTLGTDYLRKAGISQPVLQLVYQHHERWDGNGYPNRLKQSEIKELARIIQVANIFDRLSANNRYPMEEVIEYLMAKSGHEFEPLSVRNFINCVSLYPVGTMVELNTGESGVVIKSNKGFPTRPIVRIEKNMYGHVVEEGYTVDLVEKTTYFVKRRLDNTPI